MMMATAMLAGSTMFTGVSTPPPVHHLPVPVKVMTQLKRVIPNDKRRDPLAGLGFYLRLDEGRILVNIDASTEDAHIDAFWPYNSRAMELAILRAESWGYEPIPEHESPAHLLENGMVRVYLQVI